MFGSISHSGNKDTDSSGLETNGTHSPDIICVFTGSKMASGVLSQVSEEYFLPFLSINLFAQLTESRG